MGSSTPAAPQPPQQNAKTQWKEIKNNSTIPQIQHFTVTGCSFQKHFSKGWKTGSLHKKTEQIIYTTYILPRILATPPQYFFTTVEKSMPPTPKRVRLFNDNGSSERKTTKRPAKGSMTWALPRPLGGELPGHSHGWMNAPLDATCRARKNIIYIWGL